MPSQCQSNMCTCLASAGNSKSLAVVLASGIPLKVAPYAVHCKLRRTPGLCTGEVAAGDLDRVCTLPAVCAAGAAYYMAHCSALHADAPRDSLCLTVPTTSIHAKPLHQAAGLAAVQVLSDVCILTHCRVYTC